MTTSKNNLADGKKTYRKIGAKIVIGIHKKHKQKSQHLSHLKGHQNRKSANFLGLSSYLVSVEVAAHEL